MVGQLSAFPLIWLSNFLLRAKTFVVPYLYSVWKWKMHQQS